MMTIEKKGLTGSQLKLIALAAMTIDHIVCVTFPNYPKDWWILALHLIGRLAAPIFWFFVAEGYHYTHDRKKYALRLLLFAVISHFAYNFAFGISFLPLRDSVFNQTSVIWSLFWGVIVMMIEDSELKTWIKLLLYAAICVISFPSDWSCIAVMSILVIHNNRGNFKKQMLFMMMYVAMYAAVYAIFIDFVYGILQLGTALTIPLLKLYNGQKGRGIKSLFYIYYPAHLVVCGIIRLLLYGNLLVMIG